MQIFKTLLHLIYPKVCLGCGAPLVEGEDNLCLDCYNKLEKTNFHLIKDNKAETLLWGKCNIHRATAYCKYNKEHTVQHIIHQLKYKGEKELGIELGRIIGATIKDYEVAKADVIIPVPLHKSKLRQRGYNQSSMLAIGISETTNIPIKENILYRTRANKSQTRKNVYDRWINSKGLFDIKDFETLRYKTVLLVDDVVTTGATIEACASALEKIEGIKINYVCFAIA